MDGGVIPWGNAIAIPATLGVGMLAGAISGPTTTRRWLAVAVGLISLLPPFLVEPEHSAIRLAAAMGTVMVVIRSLDLARDRRQWPWHRRIWLMVSVWDSRQATFRDDRLDLRRWLATGGFGALALVAGWALLRVGELPSTTSTALLRWLLGAALAYTIFDALHAFVIALNRLFGVEVPPFHRHPILSRSLSEFWGERWNLIIHQALARHLFTPLARRRRAQLGIAAAFTGSALIHFWLMAAALGLPAAASMGCFFLVQAALMALERALWVRRWAPLPARAWTMLAVLGPSPLFTEPLLRTLGF